jgi:hypothetical protein
MEKTFFGLLLIIVLNNCTGDININDIGNSLCTYYPLKIGNVWYYNDQGSTNNPWVKSIVQRKVEINNKVYFEVTEIYGYDRPYPYIHIDTLCSDGQGRIIEYGNNKEYVVFDFTLENGKTYEYKNYVVTVKRIGSINTAVGTLNNCIELFFDIPISVDDEIWYTFAPNVGLIKKAVGEGSTLLLNSYEF